MSDENLKLLPQVPVLSEYDLVKSELEAKISKLNAIQVLTDENKKEVKNAIAEINKVKDRIKRYRIDETNRFMEYIKPYVDKCKELEEYCDKGLSDIKAKVSELEKKERDEKIETVKKLFEFILQGKSYANLLKFEMFFEEKMANKTAAITIIQKQLEEWYQKREDDINFIKKQADDSDKVLAIYLSNGLNLTKAIETYQERFKSEAEIAAAMASEEAATTESFEKKINIRVTINELPKSKGVALDNFLKTLGVDYKIEVI